MKFSVVIPTYKNSSVTVARAIDSVLRQKEADFEILVVDDNPAGSDYKEAIRTLQKEITDARVVFYFHRENRGAPAARNTAIKRAQGELIAFLDADDTWDPEYLERVRERYEQTGAAVISSAYRIKRPQGVLDVCENEQCEGHIYDKMVCRDIVGPTSAVTVKRSILLESGGFDTRLPARQDYDLWIRITRKYPAAGIHEPLLTIYRMGEESISTRGFNHIRGTEMVLKKLLRDVTDINLRKEIKHSQYLHIVDSAIELGQQDVAREYIRRSLKECWSFEFIKRGLKLDFCGCYEWWQKQKTRKIKKVVFLGDWIFEPTVGIYRVAMETLRELDRLWDPDEKVEYTLLVSGGILQDDVDSLPFKNIRVKKTPAVLERVTGLAGNGFKKKFLRNISFPLYVRTHRALGVDLTLALPYFGCDICAIYDCIEERYFLPKKEHVKLIRTHIRRVANAKRRKGRKIVTCSEYSRKDLIKAYGFEPERVHVIYCGWQHMSEIREEESVLGAYPIGEYDGFYLSLGSLSGHKNSKWVEATAKYHPDSLFLITGEGDTSFHHPANVIYTGRLGDGEVKCLMHHCKAFIQPSLIEGFGIPPLEALSLGKEVIVSDIPVFHEVYGGYVHYIDPKVPAKDLETVLREKTKPGEELLERYSWKRAAVELRRLF